MREDIIEKCLQQFLEKGIRKMTLKEIVAPLGISTKTVYKYFTSKEDLLENCLTLHYKRLNEGLASTFNKYKSPVVILFQVWIQGISLDFGTNHTFYHDLNYYYPQLQDKIIKQNAKSMSASLIKLIEQGITEGFFRKNLSAPVVLEGIAVLYASLTRTAQFKKFKLSPFQLAANTMEVYLLGLCTAKGLEEVENNKTLTSFIHKKKN